VATLDEQLAQRLLASLPAREAAAIQRLAEQLNDVDDVEHRMVVADFRKEYSAPSEHPLPSPRNKLDGVELDESLLARLDDEEMLSTAIPPTPAQSPWEALSAADLESLVDLLAAEQPQTIAVVLAKLDSSQAAGLLTQLTPTLQTEVLVRLGNLDPADDRAVEVVGAQLTQWMASQRQQRERTAAGRDLVQRILQDTPASQRAVLLARLDQRDTNLTAKLDYHSEPNKSRPSRTYTNPQELPSRTRAAAHAFEPPLQPVAATSDPLTELESLDDQALLRALQVADRQTVLLALAGAGDELLKRIVRGLPRRRANQFRQQVRAIGPTRLSDMLAAQRELLRCSET
ncbi:MAG: FliG C-terminal domain-containing protein, partial [Bythopirellula sp.]